MVSTPAVRSRAVLAPVVRSRVVLTPVVRSRAGLAPVASRQVVSTPVVFPAGFSPAARARAARPRAASTPVARAAGSVRPTDPPAGFGGAGENPGDKTVALSAAGSAALIGLIVIIVNLSTIGYIFDVSTGIGFLVIVALVVAAGLIAGGVLIYLKNPIGPYVAGGCAAFVLLIGLINLIGAFTGGGVVVLILVAIPAVLAFLPQTARYVKTANAGFGRHQPPPGRPF